MRLEVSLIWQGPFSLASPASRASFAPPSESGLYLWTVVRDGQHRICYVGEAINLLHRFYQYISSTLGGSYSLYEQEQLTSAGSTSSPAVRA